MFFFFTNICKIKDFNSIFGQFIKMIQLVEPDHAIKLEDIWDVDKLIGFYYLMNNSGKKATTIRNKLASLLRVI